MRLFLLFVALSVTCTFGLECGSPEKAGEPTFCPQVPTRDGLVYEGTENGLQRYSCGADELPRVTINGDRTVIGKYFECNSTFYRVGSNGSYFERNVKIDAFSCREYGKIDQACPVPHHTNSWYIDGVLRCLKGFYLSTVDLYDPSGNINVTLYGEDLTLTTATCEAGRGWKVEGMFFSGSQLNSFVCAPTLNSIANSTCSSLDVEYKNVEQHPYESQYNCADMENEEMVVVTPENTYYGKVLKCVSGEWQFTGANTVTIPGASKVSCRALQEPDKPVLPPSFDPSVPMISLGKTPEGLTRWMCADSTMELDIIYYRSMGPFNGKYIDCNFKKDAYMLFNTKTNAYEDRDARIGGVKCVDMGSRKDRCANR